MLNSWNEKLLGKWVLLPLRLMIGFGFMAHGYAKLSRGPEAFAVILQAIGVPAPSLMAWITSLVEFFGGLAVIVGAFVPIVSIPLVIVMLMAVFTIHLPYGFSTIKLMGVTQNGPQFGTPGYEMNLLYIAGLFTLIMGGAGPLSVDHMLAHRRITSETSTPLSRST